MDQILNHQSNNAQPQIIQVYVAVKLPQSTLNLQTNIDPDIPFNKFIQGINEQIFAQKMQVQYEETIEYQLENVSNIQQNEERTLKVLGFTNNCTLQVRLKLKGG